MSESSEIRKIVKEVLTRYVFSHLRFTVKQTNFDCSRFGDCYYAVTIKGWQPNPLAENIEKAIKSQCNDIEIGVLVSFSGKGFVQA